MDWKNKPNQIFLKVKGQMFAKGVQTFTYLDQFTKQFDPEQTLVLSSHYLNLFLNKVGIFLTTQEIRNLRDLYSKTQDDRISYRDFLEDVKYSISESIAQLINQAFEKLDPLNKRNVTLAHLIDSYEASQHPQVLSKTKSPERVASDFSAAISRKAKGGLVSKESFVDYYAQLNFCIPNERQSYFRQLLINTWGLSNSSDFVSAHRLQEIQFVLYEKIRQKSNGKTNEWKTAKKAISFFDLEDRGSADLAQFKRSLDKFGCNFKDNEVKALFEKYDTNQNGTLDYEEFSKLIMDIDISGMAKQPNLLVTLGSNHFKLTH